MKLRRVQLRLPVKLLFAVLLTLFVIPGWLAVTTTVRAASSYQNPVIQTDFPDPDIIQAGGKYYAYATNANSKNIQIASSSDLVNWQMLSDALPTLGSWATAGNGNTWAPSVIQVGGQYVMYYTARDTQSNKQCVGVATSSGPEGPFQDSGSNALVCQTDQGGTIDPMPLYDGDTLYLYYKNDGNCCSLPVHIWGQKLSSDGLSLIGDPTALISNDQSWEGNLVEAPDMFVHDGSYYLFFSANNFANGSYAVGYATCQGPLGPCQQAAENPILASNLSAQPPLIGPGGESLLQIGDQTWVAYHEWSVNADNSQGNSRYMSIDRVNWQDGKPVIQPTNDQQTGP